MPALHRAQREIGDLADLVVAEVVGVRTALTDDTASPEFVQSVNQRLLAGVARVRQNIRGELSSNRRGQAGQIPGWLGHLRESVLDDRLHFRADLCLVAEGTPSSTQCFDHEERIALGFAEQSLDCHLPNVVVSKPLRQHRRFIPGEATDFDLRKALQRMQAADERVQRVSRIDLLSPRCRRDKERETWLKTHEEVEELKGFQVTPLQVIGNQEQRSSSGEDSASGGFEETPPLLGVGS
jgi:hypothetical protein